MNVYELGMKRGQATGRAEPTDRDYDWCAEQTDGEIGALDLDDAVQFAAGMAAGAAEPDEDPRVVGYPR